MRIGETTVTGMFLYKPGAVYTAGDIVSHNGTLYVVCCETSEEPHFGSSCYEEYAYNKAIKDRSSYEGETNVGRIVACNVVEEILTEALGNLEGELLSSKLLKMQRVKNYESVSYTLGLAVSEKTDTSFKFNKAYAPDADITEILVYVTFAPSDVPQPAGHYIYKQEVVRFVLTDREQVYVEDSDYVKGTAQRASGTYSISVSASGPVASGSLKIERIEGVGTIISTIV